MSSKRIVPTVRFLMGRNEEHKKSACHMFAKFLATKELNSFNGPETERREQSYAPGKLHLMQY
jgi:hypothetical protein